MLGAGLLVLLGGGVLDAEVPLPEYASKADWLSKFPKFVKWPISASTPVMIGILGDDPFGSAAASLNVKRSKRIEDLKDCQIVFISKSEKADLGAVFDSLEKANILSVGESEGFVKQGGVIGFVMDGDVVRIEINTGAARRAGLGVDLRLLKLARRVINS